MENLFIMQINFLRLFGTRSLYLVISFLSISIFSSSCSWDCDFEPCEGVTVSSITVVSPSDYSGGNGTLITADTLDLSSITENSATIEFTIKKVATCHKVVGYGHTWSSTSATPRLGVDHFSDYGEVVTVNNKAKTFMTDLTSDTQYFVRSWIALEKQDCVRERIIYYSNDITSFKTL